MFAKLAKLAEPRAIEPRCAMPGAMRLIRSGDNQRTLGPASARQQNRRQVLGVPLASPRQSKRRRRDLLHSCVPSDAEPRL